MRSPLATCLLTAALAAAATIAVPAQRGGPMTDDQKAERWRVENELASLAIIERKVMIPMRDGIRIPADVYRPKDTSKKYPAIWVRTPYNFNFWDITNGVPRNMNAALTAVKNGFAFVEMQERGQFFAEGEWDVLGAPLTDSDDEVKWMTTRPWSNGKVGTTGCSSTAEWQIAAGGGICRSRFRAAVSRASSATSTPAAATTTRARVLPRTARSTIPPLTRRR